jgi:hypothetical protein
MENTQYINIAEYKRVIEDYIYLKKGVRINIVFDNPMMMNKHFKMLSWAYDYVIQKSNN